MRKNYNKKQYSNPFFRKKKKFALQKVGRVYVPWRVKLIAWAIFAIIIGLIWFFYFSPNFNITLIYVTGNERISAKNIEELAWKQVKRRRFLVGSQKNLNLFNRNKLIETLKEQYFFDSLVVKKEWPNTLAINVKEKEYSLIWHEMDKYYYIDSKGDIISEADPLEIKQKDYPLIDNRGEELVTDKKVEISRNTINYIIELFAGLKNNYSDLKVERFILDSDVNTVKAATTDGPQIYFNTEGDINEQITKLLVIVNKKLKGIFVNKTYIDLRYGDRVYYR